MSRDQRADDNWALALAQKLARRSGVPLAVAFCLVPEFLGAAPRHFAFMLAGLKEVEARLHVLGISFTLLQGPPVTSVPTLTAKMDAQLLVTDFDPLRIKRQWRSEVTASLDIPVLEVDAHNIVPCWLASPKREYAAYTFRPKVRRLLGEFLEPIPPLGHHPSPGRSPDSSIDWEALTPPENEISSQPHFSPGSWAAHVALRRFLDRGLPAYHETRNDPSLDGQSGLSPYLHFGQLAPQRVALEVSATPPHPSREAFLEELIVRRELADNFCYYERAYDSPACFPSWARDSLDRHRENPREYTYSRGEMEEGSTHDPFWNAAQKEMVITGKMHGYMRMYWGKKILEWSPTPEEAMSRAITLNNAYELDGRDPNGYAGIAWCIGGVHDRAFADRPVTGKIRYMGSRGLRSKFDMNTYLSRVSSLNDHGL